MIKLAAFAILIAFAIPAVAQVSEPNAESAYPPPQRGSTPNIPGTFALELGINNGLDAPSRFDLGLWGSRTINVYYQYEFRIMQSKFSLVPAVGLSLERFKFKNGAILGFDAADDSLKLFLPSEIGRTGLRKSHLVTNYLEIPLELRYSTNPSDPGRSLKIGIGGRIGYLYDAFTKIKYKEDGETKQIKDKQNFNLTRLRYGVFAKLGVGNFSLFGYYNLTPLFEEGKGPYEKNVATDFQTVTVGIALSAF